jgi:hypothetical protein
MLPGGHPRLGSTCVPRVSRGRERAADAKADLRAELWQQLRRRRGLEVGERHAARLWAIIITILIIRGLCTRVLAFVCVCVGGGCWMPGPTQEAANQRAGGHGVLHHHPTKGSHMLERLQRRQRHHDANRRKGRPTAWRRHVRT